MIEALQRAKVAVPANPQDKIDCQPCIDKTVGSYIDNYSQFTGDLETALGDLKSVTVIKPVKPADT